MINAVTKSAEDTQAFAGALTEVVRSHDLVVLAGEIGAGKTTFTQGFGIALGVAEPITSPTFVLLRSYPARLTLHHADIYRVEYLQEVVDLGLMEILDEGGVALVEWGDLASPVLPRDFLEVQMSVAGDELCRRISLRCVGPDWAARETAVGKAISAWAVLGEEGDS